MLHVGAHVMLTDMAVLSAGKRAINEFSESSVGRLMLRAVRLTILAYVTREAVRYMTRFFRDR